MKNINNDNSKTTDSLFINENTLKNGKIISNEVQNLFQGGQRRGAIQKRNKPKKEDKKNMDLETSASSKNNVIKSITNYFLKNRKVHIFFINLFHKN